MADGRQETQGLPAPYQSLSATDSYAVECAAQLFLENGLEAVRMTDIASAANVGVATLYRHFATKAAIATHAATMLWRRLGKTYDSLTRSAEFEELNGAEQLERLLETYCDICIYRKGFAVFVDDLDRLILAGDVPAEMLGAYEAAIRSIFPHFQASYAKGRADGSIAMSVDFALYYRAAGHALLTVAAKLSRGEVIPSDDFSHASAELGYLAAMAVALLKA